jgi:ERCC4-type nuclease
VIFAQKNTLKMLRVWRNGPFFVMSSDLKSLAVGDFIWNRGKIFEEKPKSDAILNFFEGHFSKKYQKRHATERHYVKESI